MESQSGNWGECAEYLREAWWAVTKALQEVATHKGQEGSDVASSKALQLAETAVRFWVSDRRLFLTKFRITEKNEETKGLTIAILKGDEISYPSILITPAALESKEELIETILHELLHRAGFMSDDKEADESEVEEVLEAILPAIMGQEPIAKLPDPPPCSTSDYMKDPSNKQLITYLANNPDKAIMINMQRLSDLIDDLRNPEKWEEGLTKKMEELDEVINEILDLYESIKQVYDGKSLLEISDRNLRERLKTIIAGGIDPDNPQPEKALAPLLWELFGIKIKSVIDDNTLNDETSKEAIKNYVDLLKKHGANKIYIKINEREAILAQFARSLNTAVEAYFKGIGESSPYTTNRKQPENPKEIVKKYIPEPGQKPDALLKLIGELFTKLYSVLPGINPYTTFALTYSPAYLSDLLSVLNINGNGINRDELRKLHKIMKHIGYKGAILPNVMGGRGSIDSLISRLSIDPNILGIADEIILLHSYFKDYHSREVSWPVELILAVLSEHEEKLEQLLSIDKATAYSPRGFLADYLLKSLGKSIKSITKLPANYESRAIVCDGSLELVRSGKYVPVGSDILVPLRGIPKQLMYSPGFVVYQSTAVVSKSYDGTVRHRSSLERIRIPYEKNVLAKICG